MRFRFNKKTQYLLLALVAILGIGSFSQPSDKGSTLPQGIQRVASWRHSSNNNRSSSFTPPTQEQATSVLSNGVRQQLGTSDIKWNGYAFTPVRAGKSYAEPQGDAMSAAVPMSLAINTPAHCGCCSLPFSS